MVCKLYLSRAFIFKVGSLKSDVERFTPQKLVNTTDKPQPSPHSCIPVDKGCLAGPSEITYDHFP